MWRRRRIIKKQEAIDSSVHAATRGAIQKTIQVRGGEDAPLFDSHRVVLTARQVTGKAVLSTRWRQAADLVVSQRFERSVRPLLDLGRRAHAVIAGTVYSGPYYMAQVCDGRTGPLLCHY